MEREPYEEDKWIVLPYIVMGICIAIGLVIGMAPELLGDVIPRHGVIGRMLTAANHRKIQDSQHTEMVVLDYVRHAVTLGNRNGGLGWRRW